ncbi:hypothetical protein GCM10027168_44070 [Streptomyces capparidis]
MTAPAAGGSVLAQWDDILAAVAPELAGHAQAVAFDADTGRLDVAPDTPAHGTKLRWIAPRLIAAANEKATGANVRSVHVLPPAPRTAAPAATAAPEPQAAAAPTGPAKTRETALAGYRLALAALRTAAPDRYPDLAIGLRSTPRSSSRSCTRR